MKNSRGFCRHFPLSQRGFKTKREANLFLASVEVSKARGEFVAPAAARATSGELGQVC